MFKSIHVMDFDRGDTVDALRQLHLGLEITHETRHPLLFTQEKLIETADAIIIKIPRLLVVSEIMLIHLDEQLPEKPKLLIARFATHQRRLWYPHEVLPESVLTNGLHFIDQMYRSIKATQSV